MQLVLWCYIIIIIIIIAIISTIIIIIQSSSLIVIVIVIVILLLIVIAIVISISMVLVIVIAIAIAIPCIIILTVIVTVTISTFQVLERTPSFETAAVKYIGRQHFLTLTIASSAMTFSMVIPWLRGAIPGLEIQFSRLIFPSRNRALIVVMQFLKVSSLSPVNLAWCLSSQIDSK